MYNLDYSKYGNRYSTKELFDNIQVVWDFKGSQPTIRDMGCAPSVISPQTYYNNFYSWKNALFEFVKSKGGETVALVENKQVATRRSFGKAIRFDVFKRDNYKCYVCGASPALSANVQLQIDHFVPLKEGGGNEVDNLRTICADCNIGKNNKRY